MSADVHQETLLARVVNGVFNPVMHHLFDRKLIVTSNRGPFHFIKDEAG